MPYNVNSNEFCIVADGFMLDVPTHMRAETDHEVPYGMLI
jgi:hypothetical protein